MLLGRLFGIPLHVHSSVFVLFVGFVGWCAWLLGTAGVPVGIGLGLGMFVSVMLHELGHALAARSFGVGTQSITFYPFGGLAALEREAKSAREEFVIAVAGPLVNGGLFVFGALAWAVLGWRIWIVFSAMNLLMMLFNLLPAFPMDGGRILRAGLATRMGWYRASALAMKIGNGFGWVFVVSALPFRSVSLFLTGVLLLGAIRTERRRMVWMWTYSRDEAGYDR